MAILEINNLMVYYENSVAINNVNLSCEDGHIVGVFGANSAGKSTLMYTISGIILNTKRKEEMKGGIRITVSGEVIFKGEDISTVMPSRRARRGIILCPERRRIFAESSTMENLRIGGVLANRQQFKETLSFVFEIFPPLKRLRNREAGFLSGGEQQMLAIGRALMAQPQLLILDEPLLGLSPLMEEQLCDAVQTINRETGITILLSEQYARTVIPIIHFGYILESGSNVLSGTALELAENPDVSAAYLGM